MTDDVPAVIARGLTKRYGSFTAVDGINLEIVRGECFGFLGPNGAGKTSTMKMIYGRFPPSAGTLTVLGLDAVSQMRAIKARIGVVSQEDNLDPDFSCLDNLLVYARYFGIGQGTALPRAQELLGFMQLAEKSHVNVEKLSGGMKRRLVIARALMNRPELVVLDEPTTGLDPQARLLVWGRLKELRLQGVTLLLTSHYMEEASRLCDRLAVIDEGRILALGSPADLTRQFAGRAVLEVQAADGAALERAHALVEPHCLALFNTGAALVCYLNDADAAPALLQRLYDADLGPLEHSSRPSTLEDVFLRLAGHRLRESE